MVPFYIIIIIWGHNNILCADVFVHTPTKENS